MGQIIPKVKIPAASGGALEGRSLSCWGNLSPKPPNKDAIPPHRKQWGILASFRDTRALACRRSQWHLWSPGAGDGVAVYGGVSLVETHDAARDGRGVWRTDECGDDQPVGAGYDRGGRRARRGSPQLRPRARGGPPQIGRASCR